MTPSATRLGRQALRVGALGAALPAATAITLAHRLPLVAGLSPASAVWQTAELWRMTLEKPLAFWQAWLACAPLPWQLWSLCTPPSASPADLACRLASAGLGGMHAGLAPIHAAVTANARRLDRRSRRSRRRRAAPA